MDSKRKGGLEKREQALNEVGFEGRLSNLFKFPLVLRINLRNLDDQNAEHKKIKEVCIQKANKFYKGSEGAGSESDGYSNKGCKDMLEKSLLPPHGVHDLAGQQAAQALVEKLKEIANKHGYSDIYNDLQTITPKEHEGVNFADHLYLLERIEAMREVNINPDTVQAFKDYLIYETERTALSVMAGMNPDREEKMMLAKSVRADRQRRLKETLEDNKNCFGFVILFLSRPAPASIDDRDPFHHKYDRFKDCLTHCLSDACDYNEQAEAFLDSLVRMAKNNGHEKISAEIGALSQIDKGPEYYISKRALEHFTKEVERLESLRLQQSRKPAAS